MEKLLAWSIEAAKDPANAGKPDPELLEKLFGDGSSEADMKTLLQTAVEVEEKQLRLDSLDAFEELVENIDNANNMGHLWQPLLYLVDDKDPEVRQMALSIVGTIVQNNDKSQQDLLRYDGSIALILKHLLDHNAGVATKCVYALTSAVGHCPAAYEAFKTAGGWDALELLLKPTNSVQDMTRPQIRSLSLVFNLLVLHDRVSSVEDLKASSVLPTLQALIKDNTASKQQSEGPAQERLHDISELLKSIDSSLV